MVYQRTEKPNGRPPKTHCPNGHEYTAETTTYFNVKSKGRTKKERRCKLCLKAARETHNEKKRAAAAAKKESWYF